MPTFFEVYQDYRKDPRSIELSKKKYKELHQRVKFHYDKWNHRQPIEYKQFTNDAGEPCEVRFYPDSFTQRMKYVIIDFCEKYKKNMAANEALADKKKEEPPPAKPIPSPKKQRVRKPVPVYTTKK